MPTTKQLTHLSLKLFKEGNLTKRRKEMIAELYRIKKKNMEKARRERISIRLRPLLKDDFILPPLLQTHIPNQPLGPPEAQFFEKVLRFTQVKHPYLISLLSVVLTLDFIGVSIRNWLYPTTPLRVAGFEILSWLYKPLFFAPLLEITHPILIPALSKLLEALIQLALNSNLIA